MTKFSIIAVTLTVFGFGSTFAATNLWLDDVPFSGPRSVGGGGPDAYGYVWLDNDTTAPGTPTYNWVDITAVGDSIEGLGDDNIVGPFSIGFDFPYYWYHVNEFYVGSNGYLRFSHSGQWAQPFPNIPDPGDPNDVLAVLVADLLFGGASAGHAYYYTNGVDSLVVSFIDVPGWNTGGSHTFQVILNRVDSTITYQYGVQQGVYSNAETLIGIENATGTVGLQYFADMLPAANEPHDSLALLFTPPDSTTYQAHDAGVVYAQNRYSGGFFVHPGPPCTLWCLVKNVGNQPEGSFDVTCEVRDPSMVVVYRDTVQVAAMNPGDVDSVVFLPAWFPAATGQYRYTATTNLGGDMNPNNNSVLVECHAMLYPGELIYDDGTYEYEWSWQWTPGQEAGMGSRFTPPSWPCRVESVSYYITSAGIIPFVARIYDDDGPDGYPGTTLAVDTIMPGGVPLWYTANFIADTLDFDDGSFYAAWIQIEDNPPRIGIDETPPISRQALEYTGTWAEFRDKNIRDVMIRAWVNYGYGVEELKSQIPVAKSQLFQNHPNPFTTSTAISFNVTRSTSNVSLRVYDLSGRLVRTLLQEPSDYPTIQLSNQVVWDGRDDSGARVSSGVYLYRLTAGAYSATEKMVLLR